MENCTPEQCTVKDTKAGQDVTCENTDQGYWVHCSLFCKGNHRTRAVKLMLVKDLENGLQAKRAGSSNCN